MLIFKKQLQAHQSVGKEQYSRNILNDYESIKSLLGTSDNLVYTQDDRNASLQASFVVEGLMGEVCRSYAAVKPSQTNLPA